MRSLPNDNKLPVQAMPYELEEFSEAEKKTQESGSVEPFLWEEIADEPQQRSDETASVFVGKQFGQENIADDGASLRSTETKLIEDEIQQKKTEIESQATAILEDARAEADIIREAARQDGHALGYEEGLKNGKIDAEAQQQQLMQEALQKYLVDIQKAIEVIQAQKDQILDEYKDSLRDLAIAIAEKVINVSLKSSGQIIEKMIVAATDRMSNKQWAKISISKYDADLMVQGDMDILAAMKNVSDNVTITVMDGAEPGTCVIEFPDQIIDASVNTQLDNIKELLS